jgi:hypothetical protein
LSLHLSVSNSELLTYLRFYHSQQVRSIIRVIIIEKTLRSILHYLVRFLSCSHKHFFRYFRAKHISLFDHLFRAFHTHILFIANSLLVITHTWCWRLDSTLYSGQGINKGSLSSSTTLRSLDILVEINKSQVTL